ncbi:MAG: putative toxin-antitoxin system toxin component, PIN family [Planctomycetes bacterium]|nr:putative toxin-antitoxin system toxin component, PIN family [Planctomycetota bacterium]
MTLRAVFDCMVYLQAVGRMGGPARACFRLVDEGKTTLFVSSRIMAEVRDVLARPKIRKRFPLLTSESVDEFLVNVEKKAIVVDDAPCVFALPRDPKDESYINLALAVGAMYLVSRDKDLLDLMNDKDFRKRYPGLTILDPAAFLKAMALIEASDETAGG